MARCKAAKKSSKYAARKMVHAPKFPADHLPAELIHMIFPYLEPTEAAAFRWAGRVVAEIGLQYLAPTVYLKLNEESYNRFLAISEHPVISKYVINLDYETRGLNAINREQFDDMVISTETIAQRHESSEISNRFASARAWRAYNRESVRNIPLLSRKQTRQLFNQAWSLYEAYLASQTMLQRSGFFREKIAEAIIRFRNLQRISTSADSAFIRYTAQFRDFLPTYYLSPLIDNAYEIPPDVGVTSVILSATQSAELHINSFWGFLNWQTFTQNSNDLATSKKSLLHLKTVHIDFTAEGDEPQDLMYRRLNTIGREGVGTGCVPDLITSAPNLEYLGLAFRSWPPRSVNPPALPMVNAAIGNFHWSSLKVVSLDNLGSDGSDLVQFCKRHTHTLKWLSLKNMQLYGTSWLVIFRDIRRAFRLGQQLDKCKLRGIFGCSSWLYMDMDRHYWCKRENVIGMIASNYIRATDVGDISLKEYCYEIIKR